MLRQKEKGNITNYVRRNFEIYVIFDILILIFTLCKMIRHLNETKTHIHTHTLEKNYMEIYKQKQNLSRETPTTILILISLCPLENKYYLPFV